MIKIKRIADCSNLIYRELKKNPIFLSLNLPNTNVKIFKVMGMYFQHITFFLFNSINTKLFLIEHV